MAADPFARMQTRLFARLGREAVLRGLPTTAILEHGVAISGEYGQVTGYRTLATLPAGDTPRQGDPLIIDGKSWTIDSILANDGYSIEVILR